MSSKSSSLDIPIVVEAAPAALETGTMIGGKYRVEGELAVGGMGIIYACTDLLLDRPVAVKVIHPSISRQETIKARFYREARTLARLNNPHITRVFECGFTDGGEPYMVMELLDGVDLYELLQNEGTLRPERVARLALQVCRGLRDAHALGVVHRDLKPENLFLTRSRRGGDLVKILDFGISKQHSLRKGRALTHPSMSLGSPHYMAPEQLRAPSEVDARADIWSLGVVMYELLTGSEPFDAENWQDVCAAVLRASPAPLTGVAPHALEAIVLRCLAREREARYESADDLADALRAFLAERRRSSAPRSRPSPLPTMTVPLSAEGSPQSGAQRHASRIYKVLSWVAAAALFAVGAVGGVTLAEKPALLTGLPTLVARALTTERASAAPAPVPTARVTTEAATGPAPAVVQAAPKASESALAFEAMTLASSMAAEPAPSAVAAPPEPEPPARKAQSYHRRRPLPKKAAEAIIPAPPEPADEPYAEEVHAAAPAPSASADSQ